MRLIFEKQATKALRRMPRKTAEAIRAGLDAIAAVPFAHHANVERIEGAEDAFRLRHGDWRAVYRVDRAAETVAVERIGHRSEVYR